MSEPERPESCPHGMSLVAYNMCRFCIDDKLAELERLLRELLRRGNDT